MASIIIYTICYGKSVCIPQTYCVETLIPKVALGGEAFVGD